LTNETTWLDEKWSHLNLREQEGETAPEIAKKLKFRSFDRFRHVVAQKIQLDE